MMLRFKKQNDRAIATAGDDAADKRPRAIAL
jgi:hypothetical protein